MTSLELGFLQSLMKPEERSRWWGGMGKRSSSHKLWYCWNLVKKHSGWFTTSKNPGIRGVFTTGSWCMNLVCQQYHPRVAGPWRTFVSRIGLLLPYWLRVVILNYPRWEWLDKWLHHETITHVTYHHLPHGQKKGPAITGHQVEPLCWAHLHDCADPISLLFFPSLEVESSTNA